MAFSNHSSSDRDSDRSRRSATLARAGAILATAGVVGGLAASGSLAVAVLEPPESGRVEISQTADRLERLVATSDPSPNEIRYLACMHDVGGSADTLERWADRCAAVAAVEARREQCLRELGGAPDARERWNDECRRRAEP